MAVYRIGELEASCGTSAQSLLLAAKEIFAKKILRIVTAAVTPSGAKTNRRGRIERSPMWSIWYFSR